MTKHIPIKVLTRLPKHLEQMHKKKVMEVVSLGDRVIYAKKYSDKQQIEFIWGRVYNVGWINK